jgi:hypothetical protein
MFQREHRMATSSDAGCQQREAILSVRRPLTARGGTAVCQPIGELPVDDDDRIRPPVRAAAAQGRSNSFALDVVQAEREPVVVSAELEPQLVYAERLGM